MWIGDVTAALEPVIGELLEAGSTLSAGDDLTLYHHIAVAAHTRNNLELVARDLRRLVPRRPASATTSSSACSRPTRTVG